MKKSVAIIIAVIIVIIALAGGLIATDTISISVWKGDAVGTPSETFGPSMVLPESESGDESVGESVEPPTVETTTTKELGTFYNIAGKNSVGYRIAARVTHNMSEELTISE